MFGKSEQGSGHWEGAYTSASRDVLQFSPSSMPASSLDGQLAASRFRFSAIPSSKARDARFRRGQLCALLCCSRFDQVKLASPLLRGSMGNLDFRGASLRYRIAALLLRGLATSPLRYPISLAAPARALSGRASDLLRAKNRLKSKAYRPESSFLV